MNVQQTYIIRTRRGTSEEWTSANTLLKLGEQGIETDTRREKFGNGVDAWNDLQYSAGGGGGSSAPLILGTRSVPIDITAVGGITPPGGSYNQLIYLEGAGGPVAITANPQVAAGVNDGEILELRGRSDTNTVKVANGNGLSLNGTCMIGLDWSLTLRWDTVNWVEVSRRENS